MLSTHRDIGLSPAQQLLPVLEAMRPGGTGASFNISLRLRITGALDPDALRDAFQATVDRHEALRSVLVEGRGMSVQRVSDHVDVAWKVSVPTDAAPDAIAAFLVEENRRAFEDGSASRCRGLLVRESDTSWVLQVTVHHSVSDAWTLEIIQRDLGAFYCERIGVGPRPEPVAQRYSEYIAEAGRYASSPAAQKARDYWQRALDGGLRLPPRNVPCDSNETAPTARRFVRFTSDEAAAVFSAARKLRLTPFMLLGTAFGIALTASIEQDDVSVQSFVSGRTTAAQSDMAGLFINPLFIPARFPAGDAFRTSATAFKAACVEAYSHQELPFIDVLEACPDAELSLLDARRAVVPVQLYRTWGRDAQDLLGHACTVTPYRNDAGREGNAFPVDAMCTFRVVDDALTATVNSAGTAPLWCPPLGDAVRHIIQRVVHDPEVRVAELRAAVERLPELGQEAEAQ